jgi:hypothetical protein
MPQEGLIAPPQSKLQALFAEYAVERLLHYAALLREQGLP